MLLATVDLGLPDGISHPQVVPLTGRPAVRREAGADWNDLAAHQIWTDVQAMLRDVNAPRQAQGLSILVLDPRLCELARTHALDMVARSYFSHDSPEGLSPFDRMERAGVRYRYAGENMALDQDESHASRALWNSSEHRSNILEPNYGKIGIAAVRSGDSEIFVEDFSN